jgi:hypothetical protein
LVINFQFDIRNVQINNTILSNSTSTKAISFAIVGIGLLLLLFVPKTSYEPNTIIVQYLQTISSTMIIPTITKGLTSISNVWTSTSTMVVGSKFVPIIKGTITDIWNIGWYGTNKFIRPIVISTIVQSFIKSIQNGSLYTNINSIFRNRYNYNDNYFTTEHVTSSIQLIPSDTCNDIIDLEKNIHNTNNIKKIWKQIGHTGSTIIGPIVYHAIQTMTIDYIWDMFITTITKTIITSTNPSSSTTTDTTRTTTTTRSQIMKSIHDNYASINDFEQQQEHHHQIRIGEESTIVTATTFNDKSILEQTKQHAHDDDTNNNNNRMVIIQQQQQEQHHDDSFLGVVLFQNMKRYSISYIKSLFKRQFSQFVREQIKKIW